MPLRAGRPPRPWRVTGAMVDVVAVLLAGTLAAALVAHPGRAEVERAAALWIQSLDHG